MNVLLAAVLALDLALFICFAFRFAGHAAGSLPAAHMQNDRR